ncbi:MAG: SDR family oxidoreductase [Actinomycetota bacterium]
MSSSDASTPQVSVVTGANSGIGRATAIYLAERGHRVIGTVRSVDKATKLNTMAAERGVNVELAELDVAIDESVERGFAEILERTGRIDHLVNNAGIGGNGVVEETSTELYHDVYNVNVVGTVRCTKAALPNMRERGGGTIVNITSVAGRIGAIAQASYVASKWALEGLSEELAVEVAPFGVRVAIIEPGVTKSAIIAKNTEQPNATGAYDAHYRQMFQMYAAGYLGATDPFEVGEVVHEAIATESPRLRYHVSWGGEELAPMHDRIDPADWVGLGELVDDDVAYAQRFEDIFGLDIRTP